MVSPQAEDIAILRHIACEGGHTVVNANAGTGKSRVITNAVNAFDPELLPDTWVTAQNKHINDANVERLPPQVYVKGPHGVGLGALYSWFPQAASCQYVVAQKYAYILRDILPAYESDWKAQRAWSIALEQLWDLARANMIDLTSVAAIGSLAAQHMIDMPMSKAVASTILQEMADRGKREAGRRVDFTDMLWLPVVLDIPIRRKFKNIFLDEAQDFTLLQCVFCLKYAEGARIHVFGDWRQAIYGFLGASGNAITYMFDHLSRAPIGAKQFPLTVCYRCTKTHLDYAREIAPEIRDAPGAIVGETVHTKLHTMLKSKPPKKGDKFITRVNRPGVDLTYTLISMGIDTRMAGKDIGQGINDMFDRVCKTDQDFHNNFSRKLDKWVDSKVARLQEEEGHEMQIASYVDRAESLRRLYYAADEQNITNRASFRKFVDGLFCDDKVDNDQVVLVSTVHKFKGLEGDHIYVLNPDQIRHPKARTKQEVQQEENIDYIARTRSRQKITYVHDKVDLEYAI